MWIVWTGGNDRLWDVLRREPRLARLPEDALVASDAAVLPRQPLELPRPRQRTLLHESRPAPTRTATGCGSTCATRPAARPVRERRQVQGRPDRRPRQDRARGLLLRRAHRRRGPAAVPEPGLRREGAARRGIRSGTTATRATTSRRIWCRPYRVGMSCAFCHVGPNPVKPPADPENPRWENLSSNVGAQFFWWDRVFDWKGDTNERSFLYQSLHTSLPGTLDTSLVSTDNINNPRTMNAVYLPRPAHGPGQALGQGDSSPAAGSTTGSSTSSCRRPIRWRSSSRRRRRPGRRACSRTAPTRSARSARSTASI